MTQVPSQPPAARGPSPYRWIIVILGALIALAAIYRYSQSQDTQVATSQLRKLSTIPPFALTERSGRQISNRDLTGKIWVADFVYTTCPGPCPLVTASMAKLQDAVRNDPRVQLVTFTVDPDTDTPPILAKYANSYHADPNRWWFLTGNQKQIYDLVSTGFKVIVQDNSNQPPAPGQYKVTHSTNFVLVDPDGDVRGYYDGQSASGRENVLNDIQSLEKESP